ncbi:MAG: hypothetical protein V1721_03445 [Pseudomonadota bacterium]
MSSSMRMILPVCGTLVFVSFSAIAGRAGYSGVIDDLPLMPGMIEKTEDALVFDAPGGRIVETVVETGADLMEIKEFYAATLPSLGWKNTAPDGFIRDNEILKIDFEQQTGISHVHFTLTPASEGK